jgi:ferric-dicitrate binding protein FerR (iron transport regulator)
LNSQLVARYLAGRCSDSELNQIQNWLEEDRSHRQLMSEYVRIWEAAEDREVALGRMFDAEQDWRILQKRIAQKPSKDSGLAQYINQSLTFVYFGMGQMMRVAAVLLIASLTGIIVYQNFYSPPIVETVEPTLREIVTSKGQRADLTLSDGTRVQLNADSRLTLPDVFRADKREVFLEGEAFFDVTKNPDKPFLIHTKSALVRILGTSLGIRSYPEDVTVRVVVKEGRVALTHGDGSAQEEAILSPGEMGSLDLANYNITTKKVEDMDLLLSWTEGYLKFKDTKMTEVALQLERKYDIEVILGSERIREMRLTANLSSRSIRNVLDVVAASLGIEYEMDQQNVIFRENSQ